jgi:2-succinyl-5-enolpyruvyl-6-hydroxy-3-cyclohexene-1-carboxylate synthase
MYSDKENVLQVVALLKAHGISHAVLCPGSRNSPIVHTLANHPFFDCHAVTDERSAGFFAIGLSLQSGRSTVVCCTSGTALLNLHPAVAEAFYQQIPLIIISADRPAAWIGQMDGQTIPQPDVFRSLVKKSVHLPEIRSEEDKWYCNRLINEAILETERRGKGPVHINVPIAEPLFRFTTDDLPEVRVIKRYSGLSASNEDWHNAVARFNTYEKCMLIAGQLPANHLIEKTTLESLHARFAMFSEHIGNQPASGGFIQNMDAILHALPESQQRALSPDLLVTYGGHIVSKPLKNFLRKHRPQAHWHVSPNGEAVDLFGSLTTIIEMDPFAFLQKIAPLMDRQINEYPHEWERLSKAVIEPVFPYSEQAVVGFLMKNLPGKSVLHLGNSSPVRYAQFFSIPDSIEIYCNRGTSGIEGSLSAAVGYASASEKLNFVVIGDLSFFYDMNALWNDSVKNNLRILLLNNGEGEIFHSLPGLDMTERTRCFVTGIHATSAKGWAMERGFHYTEVHNDSELTEAMPFFTQPESTDKPQLLEVFTDCSEDIRLLNDFYRSLRI